nr:PE family protein [Mycobacterium tuberculosis]
MSFVLVSPETVAAVATDLKRIGASLAHENASAAASTTAVVSAAADEVSTAVAALFSQHAQGYQAAAAQVAAFHSRFVQALTAGAGAYAFAEAANASPLQSAMGAVSASAQTLLSRPLIGNGRPITPGPSHPQHNQLSSRAYARRGSTTPQAMAPLHRSDAARARRRPRAGRRRIPRRW